ncbi:MULTISPECIES: acetolactate synthase large subunit [Helicobacter]|uniref:Acetolactate synthase n=8 Tax=Helicobacter typhlonius TaxID=76936 RepID=A0A099UIQ4_9HELI|nr:MULTISPECIES: acetolactate synthase large subunit [Helicobacter]TLD78203.1 acetolactate synthase large subunit [Helicobacter typhlonius]TLD86856.1 acetolactate synthase large subunit [Helicobacter sp. MIT 03-1616]CUU40679.1 Acetolactate synthase large subunit [Helicobacter typhlonius]
MKQLTGAQMIIQALHLEGVKVVFGYPGGAVLHIYDEIYKQQYFHHILARHEQGAVHSADGYARSSGEVGVAIITSGPGFTNAVTGIATAYTDSIPLVVISGQVPITQIGTDSFQEIDAVGISRPCTKHNFLVRNIAELPRILKEAFYIARSGRQGPVLVDIPKDITATLGTFDYPDSIALQSYRPTIKGNPRQIKKLCAAITHAKKPLFYIGGGAILSNASEDVRELAHRTGIPCVETLLGLGVLAHNDENLLGMLGMHGSYAANMAVSECDLLICLGARFDDRVTGKLSEFAKNAKIAHIDIDPSSIGKIVGVDYPIVGDLKYAIADMLIELNGYEREHIEQWREHLRSLQRQNPLSYEDSEDSIKPQWIIEQLGESLSERAIITTDVGQHQMWAAQFYPFSFPRQFLSSGGLGTMGYGLPAALGAKLACEDKIIVNITGDGSILMNIQELMTCVAYNIPVINVILNNNYLGMVRQWQTLFYDNRLSHVDLSLQPNFVKLIESFGGVGFRVERKDEFAPALKAALDSKKVAFIEVLIDRHENVLPMVPTGGAIYEMMLPQSK